MNNFDLKRLMALLVILILTTIGIVGTVKMVRDKF